MERLTSKYNDINVVRFDCSKGEYLQWFEEKEDTVLMVKSSRIDIDRMPPKVKYIYAIGEHIDLLSEYQNTDLTPKEVEQLKQGRVEGGATMSKHTCGQCIHYIRCLETHAEDSKSCCDFKDKALTVDLPCKVGDIVYSIEIDCIEDECEHWHEGSSIFRDDSCCNLDYDDERKCNRFKIHSLIMTNIERIFRLITGEKIGKTAFLVKEQAEQALSQKESEGE